MKESIYDLSDKELELKSILFTLDPDDKEDAAQIALIERQLDEIDASANRKILWRVRVLAEMQAGLDAIEERKRHIEKKRKSAENAVERMKKNIQDCMDLFELESVQDDEFSVSYKLNGITAKVIGLEDYDVRHLPRDLWSEEVVVKPDLNAIKKLLKEGAKIEGLKLVVSKLLRIV